MNGGIRVQYREGMHMSLHTVTLHEDAKRKIEVTVDKHRGVLVMSAWEWERDPKMPEYFSANLFGGWKHRITAPCARATKNAIAAFIAEKMPEMKAVVAARVAVLAAGADQDQPNAEAV